MKYDTFWQDSHYLMDDKLAFLFGGKHAHFLTDINPAFCAVVYNLWKKYGSILNTNFLDTSPQYIL